MSWPNDETELKTLLGSITVCHTTRERAEDAKARLRVARRHSPIINAVYNAVRYAELEREHIGQSGLYAMMALELLRAHTALSAETLQVYSRANPSILIMTNDCQRRHLAPKTWWQRFCVKLGGLA